MKNWIIVGIVLMVLGITMFAVAMAPNGFDLAKLSTVKYETNVHGIKDDFSRISIETSTADIVLRPSEDGECRVECYEEEKIKHTVSVKDGTLSVVSVDGREWYEHIGIGFAAAKITVYLPESEYESLVINENTGDVTVFDGLLFDKVDVKTSTGDIDVSGVRVGSVTLSVDTGKISLTEVTCEGDISIKVSTGKTLVTNSTCKKLSTIGSTGDVTLERVIASDSFFIKRTTGDVHFVRSDAENIFAQTSTGRIKGSILTGKVFLTDSSTGDISVPKTTEGGKCELITDTGDITINVME